MRKFSSKKLFLDLLVIVCLVVAGWVGYQLFGLHQLNLILGSIIFIVDIGVLIWNISVLRSGHYREKRPSFKLVFFSLLGVVLVLTFAGVQPLAGYKDSLVDRISSLDFTEEEGSSPPKEALADYKLRGTYTATVSTYDPFLSSTVSKAIKRTATFKEDTVTLYDEIFGKTIFKYFTGNLESAQVISLTNVATGEKSTVRFRYVAEYDCFTIGEGYSAVTYYK